MARDANLAFFDGDRLEVRFANPAWRTTRRAVPRETLLAAVAAIDPAGTRRVTLRDGALDHPAFAEVLAACRARGLSGLTLETDGPSLARPGAVDALALAGLERVFVVLGGMRRKVHEAVLSDDAFVAAFEGLRALAASPIPAHVIVPVLRPNVEDLGPLLDYLVRLGGSLAGVFPYVPEARLVPPSRRAWLLPHGDVADLAARLFDACARAGLEYGFHGKHGVLPCAAGPSLDRFGTVFFDRLTALRHASPDARDAPLRVAACEGCSLAQTCRGAEAAYVETFGAAGLSPVPLARSGAWRLKPIHSLDEHGLKSVSAFDNRGTAEGRSLVRVNGHCNMSCAFCFIDRSVPDVETAALERAIEALAARQRDHLVLSGGEPTLHPDLARLVAHAKANGFRTIEMQSNGVKAADLDYARTLVEAGLNKVTISLHSADPSRSDRITRLPKAFGKTIRAMHHFRSLGVPTQVAHVITKDNFEELPDTVRFLREEFTGDRGWLSICFGIAQPISDLVYTWVMPRFDEVRPFMRAALDDCLAHGVGFGGMVGQGGYPPCMLDGELRYYAHNLGHIYRSQGGDDFHKPARCSTCSFDPWCLGVRKDYVETYGDEEIRPFQADVRALPPPSDGPDAAPPRDPSLVQLRRRPRD